MDIHVRRLPDKCQVYEVKLFSQLKAQIRIRSLRCGEGEVEVRIKPRRKAIFQERRVIVFPNSSCT